MTSFAGVSQYAPLLVLLAGLSWFAGLWGLGRIVCSLTGLRLPPPWSGVAAVLLGIQLVSLTVQLLGMAGLASRPVLIAIWVVLATIGPVWVLAAASRWRPAWNTVPAPMLILPFAIVAAAAISGLLVAMAPSTKIDEVFYHMLVPGRILLDGALHFYRAPWVAAIWPQMVYEISSTPLHAIGFPDAPNVVSWALGVLLLSFAWRFARSHGAPPALAATLLGALCVGLYSTVWYGNGGAHAMGDLAMVAAIAALVDRQRLIAIAGHARLALQMSLLLVCAATSKISLLPICMVIACLHAWLSFASVSGRQFLNVLSALTLPWAIFYLPIMIWTWVQSGSPFGPMMAGAFGPSVYALDKIGATLLHAREGFQPSASEFLFVTGVNYSPLVWIGLLGLLLGTYLPRGARACLAALLLLQSVLILFLLPHDVRFLGGLHFGILIVVVAFANAGIKKMFETRRAPLTACYLLLLPLLMAQLYYARSFFAVTAGLEKTAFYQRNVAFFDDYAALDKVLPREAVILAVEGHTSAVYAPRPIFFDPNDLPEGKPAFLFRALVDGNTAASLAVGYRVGPVIYANDRSSAVVYRTGRPAKHTRLEVSEIRK